MKRPATPDQLLAEAQRYGLQQINEEIRALLKFLQRKPRRHVLEIGSREGGSFYLWCKLFSGKKISLDMPGANFGGITLLQARRRNREFRKWSDDVTAILANSHAARARHRVARALAGDQLDFLFIDGDHTLAGVRHDYFMYRQFVRPGGYIALHDINDTPWHRKVDCHVGEFWSELEGQKREFTAGHYWGGIGLLKVDENEGGASRKNTGILVVAATRKSKNEFARRTALGQSLRRMAAHSPLERAITYDADALPAVFNRQINERNRDKILVFTHDDVRLDDYRLGPHLEAGLRKFHIVGVAGNRRRMANQPAWAFTPRMRWDAPKNLSGAVCHFAGDGGEAISWFGESKQRCRLLDGLFLAVRAADLLDRELRFDEQFAFHFYDLDFCRAAEKRGLTLGTWPITISHGSGGSFGSRSWKRALARYRQKWGK